MRIFSVRISLTSSRQSESDSPMDRATPIVQRRNELLMFTGWSRCSNSLRAIDPNRLYSYPLMGRVQTDRPTNRRKMSKSLITTPIWPAIHTKLFSILARSLANLGSRNRRRQYLRAISPFLFSVISAPCWLDHPYHHTGGRTSSHETDKYGSNVLSCTHWVRVGHKYPSDQTPSQKKNQPPNSNYYGVLTHRFPLAVHLSVHDGVGFCKCQGTSIRSIARESGQSRTSEFNINSYSCQEKNKKQVYRPVW